MHVYVLFRTFRDMLTMRIHSTTTSSGKLSHGRTNAEDMELYAVYDVF